MKLSILSLVAVLGGAAALSACADDYAYGPRGAYADIDYGVYYDGYYGPFAGGYWAPNGRFYYPDGATGRFRRDTMGHFRGTPAPGFNPTRGHAPSAAGHGGRH